MMFALFSLDERSNDISKNHPKHYNLWSFLLNTHIYVCVQFPEEVRCGGRFTCSSLSHQEDRLPKLNLQLEEPGGAHGVDGGN